MLWNNIRSLSSRRVSKVFSSLTLLSAKIPQEQDTSLEVREYASSSRIFLKKRKEPVWRSLVWLRDSKKSVRNRLILYNNAGPHSVSWRKVYTKYVKARTDSHTRRRSPRPYSRAQPAQQLQSRSLPSASWNAVVPLYTDTIHRLSPFATSRESRTQQCLWHKKYYNVWVEKGLLYCYPSFFLFSLVFSFPDPWNFCTCPPCVRRLELAWQLRRSAQSSRKKAAPYGTFVEFVLDVAKIRRIRETAVFVTSASWPWRSGRVHRVYAGTERRIQSCR